MDRWLINRKAVEANYGALTEDEWDAVTNELAGRVENFVEEIIGEVVEGARNETAQG